MVIFPLLFAGGILNWISSLFIEDEEKKKHGVFIGLSMVLSSFIAMLITFLARKRIHLIEYAFPLFAATLSLAYVFVPRTGILGEYTFELYYSQEVILESMSMIGFLFCNGSWLISLITRCFFWSFVLLFIYF